MVRFFILVILFPALCSAQISEKFSDGDFSSSPKWVGTTEKFTVDEDYKLQLTAPAVESEAWLFTESNAIEQAYWGVRVIMGFNPSSNNLTRIYLTADAAIPAEMKNALFVEIGNTTDDICLYSQSGTNTTKLIDGVDDRIDLTSVDVRVEVTRDCDVWTLKVDTGSGFQTEGTAEYSSEYSSSYFGIYCKYTSTRSRKFWFDDIEVTGEPYTDIDPPLLMESQLVNGENIHLIFSELVDTTTLSVTGFMLEKSQRNPSSVTGSSSSDSITLHFNPALSDVEDEILLISGVSDLHGNSMTDTSVTFNYKRVFITEIKIKSNKRVEFSFSKDIDENSIEEAEATITPGEFVPEISLTQTNVVTLSFNNPLTESVEYLLTLSGFKDVSGDTILTAHLPLLYHQQARYDIVFSEIMTDPLPTVGSPESEFVEVFNRTLDPINIADWKLVVNGKMILLPEFVLMPGREVALFPASEDESWDMIPNRLPLQSWTSLTNSSSELVLISETGRVIDALRYSIDVWGDDSFKQDGGWSFERIDVNNLSDSADSWRYSVSLTGSTPGRVNSVKALLPDETAPEIELITYENPDRIKLWFTESINLFVNNLITYFEIENSSATISRIVEAAHKNGEDKDFFFFLLRSVIKK